MNTIFHYNKNTPPQVREILERYLHTNTRVRIFYGDAKTGRDWLEEYDTQGYIGRSTGTKPIALLVNNRRSLGGGAILTHCIVKITVNKRTIYEHPHYHQPVFSRGAPHSALLHAGYKACVYAGSTNIANFKTDKQAERWIEFIKGKRNSK